VPPMLLSFRKVRHISLILFNSRTEAKAPAWRRLLTKRLSTATLD